MWSHYADGFKGICVEVDVPKTEIRKLHKVKYKKTILEIDDLIPVEHDEIVVAALTHKLRNPWKIEREYRFLQGEKFLKLNISGVILGQKIGEIHKKIITDLCDRKRIPWYESAVHRNTTKVFINQRTFY